ncbi:MAG TPA: CHAT domain-containing protein [Gemmatimonadaceae bacterium]|nr:CHAT domain-containing protein [Gemmatimonadaceae bacterium]
MKRTAIPVVRCAKPPDRDALRAVSAASIEVRRAMASNPTTDALWSAALLEIWSSQPGGRSIDRAIGRLAEVRARDTTNADVLGDLAIAHLMRASDRDDARDLFVALDYAERAYARDSVSPAIRFNLALILEYSRLDEVARLAWATAADERDEAWAAEARLHIRLLESSQQLRVGVADFDSATTDSSIPVLARRDPQTAREFVMDSLTTRWARAMLTGDSLAAAGIVRRAVVVGNALVDLSTDSSVAQMAGELGRPSGAAAAGVARAVRDAARGTALFRQAQNAEASPLLKNAAHDLRRSGRPLLADWSDLALAGVELQRADYAAAERIFNAVARHARSRHALAIEGRAHWGLALSQGRRGAAAETEYSYSIAVDRFSRLGETSNAGFMQALIADIHYSLGRPAANARAMYAALDAYHRRPEPSLRFAVLLAHAQRMADRRLHAAAAVTIREAIAMARSSGRAKDYPESLARMALQQVRLGDQRGAAGSVAAARERLAQVTDGEMRERIDAEIARAEAAVHEAQPQRAFDRWDHIARYFQRVDIPVDVAPSLVARADARMMLGDSSGARADLDLAIETIARLMPRTADRDQVRRVLQTQADVFRRLVDMAVARHDTAGAYRYAELSRSDSLVSPRAQIPLPVVASDGATVAYLAAGDRLYIWVVGPSGRLAMTTATASVHEITGLAMRFVNLVREEADPTAEGVVARQLFDALLGPALGYVDRARHLTIVPDQAVADVPFAALRDGAGRFLVDRFTLDYGRHASRQATTSTHVPDDVLLVGNPSWQRSLFPDLDQLRGADREVASIRSLYPKATVLRGEEATRARVMDGFALHSVVHFAGHARVSLDEPLASHLVVARDTAGFAANVVFASDLARLNLRSVRLAVLSACGAPVDHSAPSRTNGLIQALLDAGVSAVIASQWEADDESTADLMYSLYRELSRGTDPSDALRTAQLEYIRAKGYSTRRWSTFRFNVD